MVLTKNIYVGSYELPDGTNKIWTGTIDGRLTAQIVSESGTTEEHFETVIDAVKKYPFFDSEPQWFNVER